MRFVKQHNYTDSATLLLSSRTAQCRNLVRFLPHKLGQFPAKMTVVCRLLIDRALELETAHNAGWRQIKRLLYPSTIDSSESTPVP